MPLAFPSRSHGVITFGFFNIDCDMLLLEQVFFFADRFCAAVAELSNGRAAGKAEIHDSIPGWRIRDPRKVGNVNLAIQGSDLSGFIGATYRKFPFPPSPEGFKQQPDGAGNRAVFKELIREFGEPETLPVRWDALAQPESLSIGEFVFDRETFAALVSYVDRGGYPRWRNGQRPPYVLAMMNELHAIPSPLCTFNAGSEKGI
jgi:hypothetical protein